MKLLDVVVLQALMAWVWISVIVYVVARHNNRLIELERNSKGHQKLRKEVREEILKLCEDGSKKLTPPPGYPPLPPQDDIDKGM